MKVAMVVPRWDDIRGGGEISCRLLVDTLRTLGVKVDVFAGDKAFPEIKDTWKLNIAMYRYLKKITNEYDIFHTYNMSLLPAVGLLTRKYNVNSVANLNGHVYSPSFAVSSREHLINSLLLKSAIRHIKKFTVLSKQYKEAWTKDGISQEKIQVVPNMLANDYVAKDIIHPKTINILAVGNYAKWRNLKLLLGAYSKLPKQDIILNIVGSGWLKEIMDYKGENKVMYYSQVEHDKLKRMYARADIYVQPYQHFAIGRAMLEAAQNRTAIVTTGRKQDFPYLFRYINFFANEDMLQLILQTLIKNKDLRRDQGRCVERVVNKYFNPEIITKKYIKIYEELLC